MPNPTMNKPISTKIKLPANNINNKPKHPKLKDIKTVSLLPILSTIDPNIINPTNEPKKNIPIVLDIISDF